MKALDFKTSPNLRKCLHFKKGNHSLNFEHNLFGRSLPQQTSVVQQIAQRPCPVLLPVEVVVSMYSKLTLKLLPLPNRLFKNGKSSLSVPRIRKFQTRTPHQFPNRKNQKEVIPTPCLHLSSQKKSSFRTANL